MRVDIGSEIIEIRTGSPESQIKMAAHMMNHDVIRLSVGSDYPDVAEAFIELDFPTEGKATLRTVFTTNPKKEWSWVYNVSFLSAIDVSTDDKLAISKWLLPHYSWIDHIWDGIK